jgi:ribonuclease III
VELDKKRHEELRELVAILDLGRIDRSLLNQAFTHSSYLNEHGFSESEGNERLEFLGDAILGAIITDYLYHNYPSLQEGELSKIKSVVVSRRLLARISKQLDLGRFLLLGRGEDQTGGRKRGSILANLFEALLGSIYLSNGIKKTTSFALRMLEPEMLRIAAGKTITDTKSLLQEIAQRLHGVIPRYKVVHTEGPDHDKSFVVEVRLLDCLTGSGEGKSKKSAEQLAAKSALTNLADNPDLLKRDS